LFTDTQYSAPASRPISYITDLQGQLDAKASLAQMTLKRDKIGSYSATEVDQLLSDSADTTNASLSTKRDESESYTITQIDALVSDIQAASYTSSEIDTLLDAKHPTIQDNGSLDIATIGGLGAVLSSLQPIITSGNLSISMTSGLQQVLNNLTAAIAAIPPSQILVNGGWLDQARFSISNAIPQLDLGLGIWGWRVQPMWSDIQRDAARILHARLGHLPLPVGADCLCYFPRISGDEDMGPGSLNFVTPTTADQGTWGVYELAHLTSAMPSYANAYRIFPNRDVPAVQVSSRTIGWPTTDSDSYCIEFQAKRDSGSSMNVTWSSDADADGNAPDFLIAFKLRDNGDVAYQWQDRISTSEEDTKAGVTQVGVWSHFAVQKPAGGDRLYFYVDGLLIFDTNVTANPPQNLDALQISGTGTGMFRELLIRSSCPFPLSPFTPGPVSFASVIGKGRFNSYML